MGKTKAKGELLYEKIILTNEIASIVGKSPQWIRQLTRDGVLKQVGRGKYVLGESIQAYIEYSYGGKQEDNGKPKFIDEKTDHERIKKEKAYLELNRIKGNLHEAADVEKIMTDMILSAKNRIQALPQRLAPKLANESPGVIEKVIREEVAALLSSLKAYDPSSFINKGNQ